MEYSFIELKKKLVEDPIDLKLSPKEDEFLLVIFKGPETAVRCTLNDRQLAYFIHTLFHRRPGVEEALKELDELLGGKEEP